MRILVTGAAGFMGSHLFEYLLNEGHDVLGIDNYSLGTYTHPRVKNIDLLDKDRVVKLVEYFQPEILYHLAAWAHEGLSQFAPLRITENNYNAYLNVLVPCINNGVKRVICCSSMSVYGNQDPPFDESMQRRPADVYAVAKTAMEETTEILAKVHGFEYVILRPHNVYGERQNIADPYRNVVGIFMNRAMKGLPPIIYGDGKQTRAFSYIKDVIPCVARAGFANVSGQIINVGPTQEYSVNELAEKVMKLFFIDKEPIHIEDRPLEVKHAYCTADKAISLLGYESQTPLWWGLLQMHYWVKEIGAQEFKYLNEGLEIVNDRTPQTWTQKLI